MISRHSSGTDFSPPNGGNKFSLKWQLAKCAVKTSHVEGSRYLMMEGESYPTYIPSLLC